MSKISVIIPVYNDLAGLRKTINSLCNQSVKGFEIVVINDGADEAIKNYCDENQIITRAIWPNKGSYHARNVGITTCSSEYLAFTDADTELDQHWIETGLKYLNQNDYVAGNVQIQKELVKDLATFHDYLTAFPIEGYFRNSHFGVTANLFVKKSIFDLVGLFDDELRSGGDLEFGNRVYHSGKGISQVYACDCVAYHPPRNHQEKKDKLLRVWDGLNDLARKYPDRFQRPEMSIKRNITAILPPPISNLRYIYRHEFGYSKWSLYAYLYFCKLYRYRHYLSKQRLPVRGT